MKGHITDGELVLGTTAEVLNAGLCNETRSEEQNLPINMGEVAARQGNGTIEG